MSTYFLTMQWSDIETVGLGISLYSYKNHIIYKSIKGCFKGRCSGKFRMYRATLWNIQNILIALCNYELSIYASSLVVSLKS